MPPKVPNMKFRPKTDQRIKIEADEDDDLLSSVQRERLEQQISQQPTAAAEAPRPESTGKQAAQGAVPKVGGAASRSSRSARTVKLEDDRRGVSDQPIPLVSTAADDFLRSAISMETSLQSCVSSATGQAVIRPVSLALDRRAPGEEVGMCPRQLTEDGVAFLEQNRVEEEAACALNRSLLLDERGALSQPEGSLLWFQFPKPAAAAAQYSLPAMGSGRVGKMVVYKSGRTVLNINGVEFDVSMSKDSSAQFVSTVLSNPSEGAVCYELGRVAAKVVCTPTVL